MAGRFVIQMHSRQGETDHWDLMLACGGVAETYRVACPPENWCRQGLGAERIFDHPLKFLDYEGPVNKGAGRVEIVEAGTYEVLADSPCRKKFLLSGTHFRGGVIFDAGVGAKWRALYTPT